MKSYLNYDKNKWRFIVQGFTLAGAMALADQSVVLPVMVNYFSDSNTTVGIFTALLRGGAILMQLYAAFHSRNDALVLPKMLKVFILRFTSWFSIGITILLFGENHPKLTLLLFSMGLFLFSFAAGFGTIYYQELMGKMFTKQYRGKLIAQRQILSGLTSIIGVLGISGFLLEKFDKPYSFAYIFLISSAIMAIGFLYFIPFKEDKKTQFSHEEKNFATFMKKAAKILKTDKQLRIQIASRLFSFGFLMLMPFIILRAKQNYGIDGKEIAFLAATQMAGAVIANFLWGKLSGKGNDKAVMLIALIINIIAYASLLLVDTYYLYFFVFFVLGAAVDGYRLVSNNLILSRAPEKYRPTYVALYNNIIAIGLFASIPGGIILDKFGFNTLNIIAIILLVVSFLFSLKLRKNCTPAQL